MFGASFVTAALLLSSPSPESEIERLHRKGVHCMEELERNDCAIEQFEAVLEEDTRDRELITDAMMRLIRLYRAEGDDERLKQVLRRYWDVGVARQSRGHLPYGMRFIPAELDVMFVGDIARARESAVMNAVSPNAAEFIFTCDESARADILMTERWRRAELAAARNGTTTQAEYYEAWDDRRAKRARRDARRAERASEANAEPKDERAPIFSELPCDLAERLGQDSLLGWTRISGAASHQDYPRSVMLADIPGVDRHLDGAVRRGELVEVEPGHWRFPAPYTFAGQPVHVVRVDLDQLLVARGDMVQPIIEASRKRKRRMHRELERLAQQVPRDSAMVFAMTRAAVVGSGFGDMGQGAQAFLQALLPKPKGLQVSVALSDVAGIFTRMPTKNPVKGRMLVKLANSLIARQAGDDPEAEQMLENLDIAEAGDRRALLATYLLGAEQMATMMWED